MGAMLRFKQETGREITEIDPTSLTDLCAYLWCCIVSAAKREGKQFNYSLMDFADSIDPGDMQKWNEAITAEATEAAETEEKKPIGVYDLLGMAVGCIGMSHDDFCKCTFGEFEIICKAWREMTGRESREVWERARTIATILIQPHVKKRNKVTPRQLLLMPWDKEREHQSSKPLNLTTEEQKSRFEKLDKKLS